MYGRHVMELTNSERLALQKLVNKEVNKAVVSGRTTVKRLEMLYNLQSKLKIQGDKYDTPP